MEEATQKLSVGELKYRDLVTKLYNPAIAKRGIVLETESASKARNLRRNFYRWQQNLAGMERTYMDRFTYILQGRRLKIEPKITWAESLEGITNATHSQSEPS